jgi:hypothetical protein
MTEFVVLSRVDMHTLCDDKPVTIWINGKPYVLCTDEYFEKQNLGIATDEEIAKSFIEDVEAVKDLLPRAESEEK